MSESISFPRYDTPTGKIVGELYLGKELGIGCGSIFGDADSLDPRLASSFYAQDRFAAKDYMLQILDSGINLISDRYYQANMGHQGGKIRDSTERAEMYKWIEDLELGLYGIPREDGAIFLYMPTDVALELRKHRGEKTGEKADGHESNIPHLRRSEFAYLELADRLGWNTINSAPDGTINSLRSMEDIHEEVYDIAKGIIGQ